MNPEITATLRTNIIIILHIFSQNNRATLLALSEKTVWHIGSVDLNCNVIFIFSINNFLNFINLSICYFFIPSREDFLTQTR